MKQPFLMTPFEVQGDTQRWIMIELIIPMKVARLDPFT